MRSISTLGIAMLSGCIAALLLTVHPAVAADTTSLGQAIIRPYTNGAGPSAIFRFARQEDKKRDVFAVVDPALWRIQFFTLDDWSAQGQPFTQRFKKRGDCALPPSFRLWRVHLHDQRVVLQSQPIVPRDALIYTRTPASLSFQALQLSASQKSISSAVDRTATPEDDLPAVKCAEDLPDTQLRAFSVSDAATKVTGGENKSFVLSRTKKNPGIDRFFSDPITIDTRGRFLASAQELESSVVNNSPARHFLLTARTQKKGFVSTEILLERRSPTKSLNANMRINLGLSRVKMGHRSVALASTGEVLVMGTFDKKNFYVHPCYFAAEKRQTARCDVKDDDGAPVIQSSIERSPEEPGDTIASSSASSAIWRQAFNYAEQEYTIDTKSLPKACHALKPQPHDDPDKNCVVSGSYPWSPITELRLAKGEWTRKGVPYAQSSKAQDRPHFGANAKVGPPVRMPILALDGDKPFIFSDIENHDKTVSGQIRVFGIDCSAFLSHLWQMKDVIDTNAFISRAGTGIDPQISRVASLENARLGDAFVINIAHTVSGKRERLLNHIVLFREARPSGPTDSSRAILVVEASSSCGGVCWSFYDESFFNGWAIIKRSPSSKPLTDAAPIPGQVDKWRELFAAF
jgi:hypothetical protein